LIRAFRHVLFLILGTYSKHDINHLRAILSRDSRRFSRTNPISLPIISAWRRHKILFLIKYLFLAIYFLYFYKYSYFPRI
jgi:hypothetical protein